MFIEMNKKAQIGTMLPFILMAIVIIFIFSVVVVPVAEVSDQTFDELKETEQVQNQNTTTEKITQVQNFITPALDQLVFVIMIAMIIGILVIALFTNYHPVILGVLILVIIFVVLIAGLFSNVDDEIQNVELLQNKSAEFTFKNAIMGSHLPIIFGFIGIVAIIILLSKRGGQIAPI